MRCAAQDVYDPELWRTIPYLLCISLIGIFILLQLHKRFIVDYALPYPSGTASGVLINSLHKIGDKTAGRQVHTPHHTPLDGSCKGLVSLLENPLQTSWMQADEVYVNAVWGESIPFAALLHSTVSLLHL